jgi:GH15 family glucan-1,4-alpha-glucosidase
LIFSTEYGYNQAINLSNEKHPNGSRSGWRDRLTEKEKWPMPYQPIENYGIVGDLHTIALIGMDGSVDFMCLPFFDSPSVFAALLDDQKGGRFKIAPILEGVHYKQIYLSDSNVLLSRFLSDQGVAEVSDFMPIAQTERSHSLVRRAKTVRGVVRYQMICQPAFDYARVSHKIDQQDDGLIFIPTSKGLPSLRLRSEVPVHTANGKALAEFTLSAGETAYFILEQAQEGMESPSSSPDYVSRTFMETVNFWRRWIGQSGYQGRWRETVNRSSLLLKLLTSKPFGSIVAAPTFGLPETIGGERNWDYRYTWIRDASFTLYALIRMGFTEEAGAFMDWLEARCNELNPDGSLQTMYTINGGHELPEVPLTHLEGYKKSSPVRIGNKAYKQLQLDIYGELMDSVYLYDEYGQPLSHDLWANLIRLINWLCENWQKPDEGIWEVRGGPREFLYSRLMSWVALDRGIRLALKRSFPAPLERWRETRDDIYRDIFKNFWNPARKAFVQYKSASDLDASVLLMPLVHFISPRDPRWLSTMKAIEEDLVSDSLVSRYVIDSSAVDGLHGHEGTFNMTSFWYVECLSRAGELQKARFFFEKMHGYANHLGLYSEELGPQGEHLGNFPQAFTHLGLISAAYDIDRRLTAAGWTA